MDAVMIVDPGSMVCVDFATRTRGITVGFTWRWFTQKPVSIKSGKDQFGQTLAGVGLSELE
jgi:hypothetical protein